MHSEEED